MDIRPDAELGNEYLLTELKIAQHILDIDVLYLNSSQSKIFISQLVL